MSMQVLELEKGVDILIVTPGRLIDLLNRSKLSLSMIKYLALNKADRLLNLGFGPCVSEIIEQTDMPAKGVRQTMLFSSNFSQEVRELESNLLSKDHIHLAVGRVLLCLDPSLIVQTVHNVRDSEKRSRLMDCLLHDQTPEKQAMTLIYVETKREAASLEILLKGNGFRVTSIHGNLTFEERDLAMKSFSSGDSSILVTTDVVIRGWSLPDNITHVINFDLPSDIEDYEWRKRTGLFRRSGGCVTSFFNQKNMSLARPLIHVLEEDNQAVPEWLASLK